MYPLMAWVFVCLVSAQPEPPALRLRTTPPQARPGPGLGWDVVPGHEAFSPHVLAFHVTPIELGLGMMLP